jgi:ATP-dependent Lon protease
MPWHVMAVMAPILVLHPPLILLPTARLTLSISHNQAHSLLDLASQPLVAVVPYTTDQLINEYAVAARILRLTQSNDTYLLTLLGITRVKLASPLPPLPPADDLLFHPISPLVHHTPPKREAVEAFKLAALALIDRLARDASHPARRRDWLRFSDVIANADNERMPWIADVCVAPLDGNYRDRLGPLLPLFV